MKKMPKVDEYDPVIYPRMLWVTGQLEGLNKIFTFTKMNDTSVEAENGYRDLLDTQEYQQHVQQSGNLIERKAWQ